MGSGHELVFRKKAKLLFNSETEPDVNISGTF